MPAKPPQPALVLSAAPTPSEAWLAVYREALAALLYRLDPGKPVSGADRARVQHEAATIADESLTLWRARFAA